MTQPSVNDEPKRILIIRTDRIGDVILTLPMAQALRRIFPGVRIAMLVQKYTAEAVACNGSVDEIVQYDNGRRPLPFWAMVATLRRGDYDVVFHTHPRFRLALMTRIAGIPMRIGTGYRWYSFLFNLRRYEHRKDARFHELEYNLHLLEAAGWHAEPADARPRLTIRDQAERDVAQILRRHGIAPESRLVILHPGSGSSARDWPPGAFIELAGIIAARDDCRIVVTGSEQEMDLASDVAARAGAKGANLAGALTIEQLAALARRASVFVANSTGPIHIAATVGTPVVGLYPQITALSAARWGPYTDRKTIFSPKGKPSDCSKCLNGRAECECMATISTREVAAAVVELLHKDWA